MDTILFHLNYLGKSSQRELDAYRNIGSVGYLKRLKQQEVRRMRVHKRIKAVLKNLLYGIFIVGYVWLLLSWIDTVAHNTDPEPVYQAWNFFNRFT